MIAISICNYKNDTIYRFLTKRKYISSIIDIFNKTSNINDLNSFIDNNFNYETLKYSLYEYNLQELNNSFIINNTSNIVEGPFNYYHVGFVNGEYTNNPLYVQKDIHWISHRINTIKELTSIPSDIGIEIDLRDSNGKIIVTHDPFTDGPEFSDFIKKYSVNNDRTIILNIKSERIEESVIKILNEYNITNYFLLDSSFPMINNLIKKGINNIALRYSEYEGLDTLINMKGLVKWVWVDWFNVFSNNGISHFSYNTYIKLRQLGYKICIVSPDLQGNTDLIEYYAKYLLENNIFVDAICTKKFNIQHWNNVFWPLKESKIYWPLEYSNNIINVANTDNNGRKLNIFEYFNVELCGITTDYPNVILKTNNKYVLPIHDKFMSLNRGTIYEEHNMRYIIKEELYTNIHIISDPVLFFIYNTDNYYHFLYDAVPYLYYYKFLRSRGIPIKLLMNRIKYKFIKETLDLFLDTSDDIIIHNSGNYYKKLFIGTSMTHGGLSDVMPHKYVYSVYSELINKVNNIKKYEGPLDIYISRRTWIHNDLSNIGTNYTTRRKLMNEDQLVETLVKNNFTEIFCENMSMIEKISLFSNARTIIGAIGGGLANLVFSSSDTKVVCIVSPTFLEVNNRFIYSMNHTNIKYIYNTNLYGDSKISLYTRIQIIDPESKYYNYNGEIIEILNNGKYKIQVGTETTTGWNSSEEYPIIEIDEKYIKQHDKGLNSPWYVDIPTIIDLIN